MIEFSLLMNSDVLSTNFSLFPCTWVDILRLNHRLFIDEEEVDLLKRNEMNELNEANRQGSILMQLHGAAIDLF